MNNLNEMLEKISDFLRSEAKTETIIGQQFKLGDYSCVPVMSLGIGFGGGSGENKVNAKTGGDEGTGVGAGGGMGLGPIGFLVTKGEEIKFIATQPSKGLGAVADKIPGLLEKLFDKARPIDHAQ